MPQPSPLPEMKRIHSRNSHSVSLPTLHDHLAESAGPQHSDTDSLLDKVSQDIERKRQTGDLLSPSQTPGPQAAGTSSAIDVDDSPTGGWAKAKASSHVTWPSCDDTSQADGYSSARISYAKKFIQFVPKQKPPMCSWRRLSDRVFNILNRWLGGNPVRVTDTVRQMIISSCVYFIVLYVVFVAFIFVGGSLFSASELPREEEVAEEYYLKKKRAVLSLINITREYRRNASSQPTTLPNSTKQEINTVLRTYLNDLTAMTKKRDFDPRFGPHRGTVPRWSLAGGLLHVSYIISTVGTSELIATTVTGRWLDILVVAIGVPLHIILLTHAGFLLSTAATLLIRVAIPRCWRKYVMKSDNCMVRPTSKLIKEGDNLVYDFDYRNPTTAKSSYSLKQVVKSVRSPLEACKTPSASTLVSILKPKITVIEPVTPDVEEVLATNNTMVTSPQHSEARSVNTTARSSKSPSYLVERSGNTSARSSPFEDAMLSKPRTQENMQESGTDQSNNRPSTPGANSPGESAYTITSTFMDSIRNIFHPKHIKSEGQTHPEQAHDTTTGTFIDSSARISSRNIFHPKHIKSQTPTASTPDVSSHGSLVTAGVWSENIAMGLGPGVVPRKPTSQRIKTRFEEKLPEPKKRINKHTPAGNLVYTKEKKHKDPYRVHSVVIREEAKLPKRVYDARDEAKFVLVLHAGKTLPNYVDFRSPLEDIHVCKTKGCVLCEPPSAEELTGRETLWLLSSYRIPEMILSIAVLVVYILAYATFFHFHSGNDFPDVLYHCVTTIATMGTWSLKDGLLKSNDDEGPLRYKVVHIMAFLHYGLFLLAAVLQPRPFPRGILIFGDMGEQIPDLEVPIKFEYLRQQRKGQLVRYRVENHTVNLSSKKGVNYISKDEMKRLRKMRVENATEETKKHFANILAKGREFDWKSPMTPSHTPPKQRSYSIISHRV